MRYYWAAAAWLTLVLCFVAMVAYATSTSKNVAISVTHQQGGGGCAQGDICPPGVTWTNVIHEDMTQGKFSSSATDPQGCFNSGVHGPPYPFTCPGLPDLTDNSTMHWGACPLFGGQTCLIMPGNLGINAYNQVTSTTTAGYGYYSGYLVAGDVWNVFWIPGNVGGCPPNPNGGAEFDIMENPNGSYVHMQSLYGAYNTCLTGASLDEWSRDSGTAQNCPPGWHDNAGSCATDFTGIAQFFQGGCPVSNCDELTPHIFGLDWSPTRGTTYYYDGIKMFSLPGTWTPGPPGGQRSLLLTGAGNSTPFQILWWNYYTGNPQ